MSTIENASSFKLCDQHARDLDDLARSFPPSIETSFLASKFLMAIAGAEAEPSDQLLRCPACALGKGDAADAAYALIRAIRCALPPESVPLDLVLKRIDPAKEQPPYQMDNRVLFTWPMEPDAKSVTLHLFLKDHRENPLPGPLTLEAFFEGPARSGKHLRFVLDQLAPGVQKLRPSVQVSGMICAFITILD